MRQALTARVIDVVALASIVPSVARAPVEHRWAASGAAMIIGLLNALVRPVVFAFAVNLLPILSTPIVRVSVGQMAQIRGRGAKPAAAAR